MRTAIADSDDRCTQLHLSLIADLAGRYRLPSIVPNTNFAKNGGPERHSAIATSPTDVLVIFFCFRVRRRNCMLTRVQADCLDREQRPQA
jgi:hypothetical protein